MLKPCPFCGCEAVLLNEFFDDYLVMCSNSGCAAEGPLKATSDEAETAWNTRPDERLVDAEYIRKLEDGIRAVRELMSNSHGVSGLHLNGDIAEWGSLEAGGYFEAWLEKFTEAEAALTGKGE